MDTRCEVLTTDQMYAADKAAIEGGIPGTTLMENAGRAVAETLDAHAVRGRVAVLCGPGNNGGDGFAAARYLREMGWNVRVALLGSRDTLRGDAAHHAAVWDGAVEALSPQVLDGADAAVDALFGAGLTRPLEGAPREVVAAVNARAIPTVAVDIPSGIAGDTGAIVGDTAVHAVATATFYRRKPGHLLLPGARHCGRIHLADIGIPEAVLPTIAPRTTVNDPSDWGGAWPWRTPERHKYDFGHAVVLGGATATGAGRLAAHAALRTGAGLVSVAAPPDVLPVYAAETASLITVPFPADGRVDDLLGDRRRNAWLLGPGAGVTDATRQRAETLLAAGRALVLDADSLSVFANDGAGLARCIRGPVVLTPHEGEFRRVFPDLSGDKLSRARAAAARTGAVLVIKGADSVIAAPDGRAAINATAPAELATAGTGDVLAGMILGGLAQGLEAFDAARAGVWLHGIAAQGAGPGLIAGDLVARIPAALRGLRKLSVGGGRHSDRAFEV